MQHPDQEFQAITEARVFLIKYLGSHFSANLSWGAHQNTICSNSNPFRNIYNFLLREFESLKLKTIPIKVNQPLFRNQKLNASNLVKASNIHTRDVSDKNPILVPKASCSAALVRVLECFHHRTPARVLETRLNRSFPFTSLRFGVHMNFPHPVSDHFWPSLSATDPNSVFNASSTHQLRK